MKKNILFRAAVAPILLLLGLVATFTSTGESTLAQEQRAGRAAATPESFSDLEVVLKKRISALADTVESAVVENEPSWKLKKKISDRLSEGISPQSRGGGKFFGASAYLRFERRSVVVKIEIRSGEPSTEEETSSSMKLGLSRISRGVIKPLAGIGDEAVMVSDVLESRNNSVYVKFRSDKTLIEVGVDSPNGGKNLHEQIARAITQIVDSAIRDLKNE